VGLARLAGASLNESAPLNTRIGQTTVVPAEVSSHGMFVSVMISGQGPFRMMIDTGCSICVISPEVAAAIKASGREIEDQDLEARNGLGESLSMPQVLLDSVKIGGVEFEGVAAGVVPLELQAKIEDRPLDGLLGYSLFSDLFFALDYPGHRLVLSTDRPKNLPPTRAELAITEQSGVPFVTVRNQGRAFTVMVDLGANDPLHLPPELVKALKWQVEPRPGFLLAVAGGTSRERIGRLAGTLELGPVRQLHPAVGLSEGPASIGVGLLHSYCILFHEAENKVWLCSPHGGSLPSPAVRTVGLSLFADPGGWRVAGTIPGSPAEKAGISTGDLVTQIEGLPASDWRPDQIQAWIDTHATMALRLVADAAERQLKLPVWALVP
jgi:predicted aspartyl protease